MLDKEIAIVRDKQMYILEKKDDESGDFKPLMVAALQGSKGELLHKSYVDEIAAAVKEGYEIVIKEE